MNWYVVKESFNYFVWSKYYTNIIFFVIVHLTVVCLVAKPLNRNEAKGDLVMIQTLLLFKCKLLCNYTNKILVSVTTWSTSASLQIKGLATKYTTVKWPIRVNEIFWWVSIKCILHIAVLEPWLSMKCSLQLLSLFIFVGGF